MTTPRDVLIVAHTGRRENVLAVRQAVTTLREAGARPWLLRGEHHDVGDEIDVEEVDAGHLTQEIDVVFVLGGDGTILRAAELSRGLAVPLLGVNLGQVGFLAEHEREELDVVVQRLLAGDYTIEERLVLDVAIMTADGSTSRTFAVNEATVEKADRGRVLEVVTEVDGRPVSTFGGDGVVLATPTGSTAYNFSAGGPVVWPDVEAMAMVPICAHALFAKPLVVSPASTMAVEVLAPATGGIVACDGRRRFEAPAGTRIEVTRSRTPLLLARMSADNFADRLVRKFRLPVAGWRGPVEES